MSTGKQITKPSTIIPKWRLSLCPNGLEISLNPSSSIQSLTKATEKNVPNIWNRDLKTFQPEPEPLDNNGTPHMPHSPTYKRMR
jgi:hypothetical protein